jgi:hypothetical protein
MAKLTKLNTMRNKALANIKVEDSDVSAAQCSALGPRPRAVR